jgi:hypothetical protein
MFSEESQENADFENFHLMAVLFNIFSIGWLSKYVGTFTKKSKYIYSLPQRLSRYRNSNLHRHGKKNVCGKFIFLISGFSDMPWFLDLSLINSRSCQRKRHIRKTIEEEKFSAHVFFTVPMKIQIDICRQTLR